jgi:hypothetical protein
MLSTCLFFGLAWLGLAWLGLFFDPEGTGDIFFRNFGRLSTDYTALYPRR